MKTKVAQFIGSTGDGGAERVALEYATHLNKEQFESIIIVRRRLRGTANDRLFEQSGIKIYEIYKHHSLLWKILQKPFDDWYTSRSILRILQREHVDVLHIHLELLKFVLLIRKRIDGVKLFFTAHSEPSMMFSGRWNIERYSAKKLISHNNLVLIALHQAMKNELSTLFQNARIEVIHNGIDIEKYVNVTTTKCEVRRQLGIPEDAFVIGHVGRFVPPKNHSQLVDMFIKLKSVRRNSFLFMIGSGVLKEEIITRLNQNNFDGSYLVLSHRDDVPNLLQAMDVFVFPSIYEGLSIALIEAQIAGLRCVVSDRIKNEAIVTEGNSMLSLSDTEEEWCSAIVYGAHLVKAGLSIDSYNMNVIIKGLEKLYLE